MKNNAIIRLKLYVNDDEIYQDYKKGEMDFTDFEQFCIQHCKDIEELLEENQKMKEVIKKIIGEFKGDE